LNLQPPAPHGDVDPGWTLCDGPVPSGRRHVFLYEGYRQVDESGNQAVQMDYPVVSDSAAGADLCRLVLFHVPLLPDALAAQLLGHGHAVVSAGERIRARRG
jgi:hypothetical protein